MLVIDDSVGLDLVAGILNADLHRVRSLFRTVLHELDEDGGIVLEGQGEKVSLLTISARPLASAKRRASYQPNVAWVAMMLSVDSMFGGLFCNSFGT